VVGVLTVVLVRVTAAKAPTAIMTITITTIATVAILLIDRLNLERFESIFVL
jgi:hypothetical protein